MSTWIANLVSSATPLTRGFSLRRQLFGMAGASIARSAKINGMVVLANRHVSIGHETWVGAGARLFGGPDAIIRIGDRCDIGPKVAMVAGTHDIGDGWRRAGPGRSEGIDVGDGTWIGTRATFLAGSAVGQGCMVAAGALVRDRFPDNVVIAGIPARIVRELPR